MQASAKKLPAKHRMRVFMINIPRDSHVQSFLAFREAYNQTLQRNPPFAVVCVSLATNQRGSPPSDEPSSRTAIDKSCNGKQARRAGKLHLPGPTPLNIARWQMPICAQHPYCALPLAGIGCASTGQRRHALPRLGKSAELLTDVLS